MNGSFRKVGKTWQFTVDLGRDPRTGKRKRLSRSGFKTKRAAQAAHAEFLAQVEKGEYIGAGSVTLSGFQILPSPLKAKEMTTWTPEQTNHFLQFSKANKYYIAFILALYTGMRCGEILGLGWRDIDLDTGKINIRNTLYRIPKQGLVFQEPKTNKSKRQISVPESVIENLKKHWQDQLKHKLALSAIFQENDLVVCHEDGRPVDPRTIVSHFERLVKKSELPKLRFNDLRRNGSSMREQH